MLQKTGAEISAGIYSEYRLWWEFFEDVIFFITKSSSVFFLLLLRCWKALYQGSQYRLPFTIIIFAAD